MNNIYCLFWVPGSCGDILRYLASTNKDVHTGLSFDINNDGRVINSDPEPSDWLQRQWSESDCDNLIKLSQTKSVLVGTHRIDQLTFIKKTLGNSVTTIGVNYTNNIQKFVLKNYCLKILNSDTFARQHYKTNQPALFEKFDSNNALGPWALKNELTFLMNVPAECNTEVNHAIDLSALLAGNLQWASTIVPIQSQSIFKQWLEKQNPLFTHKITGNKHYDNCIGNNKLATKESSQPFELDLYDKIFVNHYTKIHNLPPCKATTHAELIDFFEKL